MLSRRARTSTRKAKTKRRSRRRRFSKHGFESIVLHHQGVTPEKVQKIKAAGIEVGAWTVNDRAAMEQLLDAGVERIYTDNPRLLLSLKSR